MAFTPVFMVVNKATSLLKLHMCGPIKSVESIIIVGYSVKHGAIL